VSRRGRDGQREAWEDLSALDPLWAICSERERRFGGWDRGAFLQSGVETVDAALRAGARFGVPVGRTDALDFGCGTGRLTIALARDFEHCLGVDISAQMVEQARTMASGVHNCTFAVHEPPDLGAFESGSFDLVMSRFVLQHLPGASAKERYIKEFVRVLRPGGMLALQLPSEIPTRHRIQPRPRAYGVLRRAGVPRAFLYRRLRLHPIRMTSLPKERVAELIAAAGGRVLEAREEAADGGVTSTDYLATKGG
jgi:SAM-dependent methyltransferase